jgi:hypothetical protein
MKVDHTMEAQAMTTDQYTDEKYMEDSLSDLYDTIEGVIDEITDSIDDMIRENGQVPVAGVKGQHHNILLQVRLDLQGAQDRINRVL